MERLWLEVDRLLLKRFRQKLERALRTHFRQSKANADFSKAKLR